MHAGIALQQRGELGRAEVIYRQVLRRDPRDSMVRNLLGLTLCQSRRYEEGLALINEAIAQTNDAYYHFSLGHALAEGGRLRDAADAFGRSLAMRPDVAAAHAALGHVLRRDGQPKHAVAAYSEALMLEPNNVDTLCGLAEVLLTLGDLHQAATVARLALRLNPDLAAAHHTLGTALWKQGDPEAAIASFRAALALQPFFSAALCNLSAALYNVGDYVGAAAAAEKAIGLRADYVDAFTNLGNALQGLLRYTEAEAAYRTALRLQPDSAAAHSNLSVVLTAQGALDEALAAQQTALQIDPDFTDAAYNHAVTLLKAGDYERGWPLYETRWKLPWSPPRGFAQPQWRGEDLAGRVILLHPEQGLGDTLQMVRYAPMVAARGGRVILEVPAPLVRLLRHLPGVESIARLGEPLPPFDLHCPLFSLPQAFRTRLETVPSVPYLRADPNLSAAWADRLGVAQGLRVGLVWAGAERIGRHVNRERSIRLEELAPFASIPGVHFYSLQKDLQAGATQEAPGLMLQDFMDSVQDFADTAALVSQLDLVISVDTSTAHLAAGMGKPVWLMSRHNGCWRWLAEGRQSPWYPTLEVYRQRKPSDWTPVVAELAGALVALAAGR